MEIDITKIVESWENDEPRYRSLGEKLYVFIKAHITDYELFPEVTQRTKDLLSIVKKIKKKNREKSYSYEDLSDKLGIRIICTYQEDLIKVDAFLGQYFAIVKAEYKKDTLDFDKLDYTSNHYDVKIDASKQIFEGQDHYLGMIFEVQVRTLNQHAWSNTAHSLAYKQEAGIEPILKRRVYRLLSLYEIADDEFSSVNRKLAENPDNPAYQLLRKLESKVYKYAKVDFDRVTSLYNIKIILSFLTDEQQQEIRIKIDNFITENDEKLSAIFDENRFRFHEMDLITQPEIFLVWYLLEHYQFVIKDNWADEFDWNELEQAAILWGTSVS